MIEVPVVPLTHTVWPIQPVATKVTVSLLHKIDLGLEIIGATGELPGVIVTIFDALLVPQLLTQVAL
jgi:hypothetical protein